MSFNRENIIWQSEDGSWNRGFYTVTWVDPEGDPEWDVEYGEDFEWVSTGHASEEAAHLSWDGPNPGGYSLLPNFNARNAELCAELDRKAEACEWNDAARRKARRSPPLGTIMPMGHW